MPSLCLYFKFHTPYQLRRYAQNEIGSESCYENNAADEAMINNIIDENFLPANETIFKAIEDGERNFKVAFSLSGTALQLISLYRPDAIESFRKLVNTGCVEILGETFYHSLSALHSKNEFKRQVLKHKTYIEELFNYSPVFFRNTELIYNNWIAETVAELGFKGILCEGLKRVLIQKSANKIYNANSIQNQIKVLFRNISLSDDIAFRFAEENWEHHPLTAEKFAGWVHEHKDDTQVINLFLDYETFGLHKKESCGIFDFLKALPANILQNNNWKFSTPSEVLAEYESSEIFDSPGTISWKDQSRASCVWCENMMQNNTLKKIYSLENLVKQAKDEKLLEVWGRLQSADYFYYMNADHNNYHRYTNPFADAKEAYNNYSNIITDFEISLIKKILKTTETFHNSSVGTLY